MRNSIHLSKTRIKQGLQCEKNLYLQVHRPRLASPYSAHQQMIFDQGHEVHREAQKKLPHHVMVTADYRNLHLAQKQTQEALDKKAPYVCEAFFF